MCRFKEAGKANEGEPWVQLLGSGTILHEAIAATHCVWAFADQTRAFVPMKRTVLGADGFGRPDTRANARRHLEADRHYIALAAVASLDAEGKANAKDVARAIKEFAVESRKQNPTST
jgi:pyruvate dehydrogenase E1 component